MVANLQIPESQSGGVLSTENSLTLGVARDVVSEATAPSLRDSLGSTLGVAGDVVSEASAPGLSKGIWGRESNWVGLGLGVGSSNGLSSTLGVARDVVPEGSAPCLSDSLGGGLGFTLAQVLVLEEVTGNALGVARDVVSEASAPCIGMGKGLSSTLGVARDVVSEGSAPCVSLGDSDSDTLDSGCCKDDGGDSGSELHLD